MNFNPTNEQGLLSLVAALKGGMDPSTAYSMYQGIASDQATELARRQERLTSLSDLMMDAAGGGATYEQASMLAEAQPGPAVAPLTWHHSSSPRVIPRPSSGITAPPICHPEAGLRPRDLLVH